LTQDPVQEKPGNDLFAKMGQMSRLAIFVTGGYHARPDRIAMEITHQLDQIGVDINKNGPVSSLKEMSRLFLFPIDVTGESEVLNDFG